MSRALLIVVLAPTVALAVPKADRVRAVLPPPDLAAFERLDDDAPGTPWRYGVQTPVGLDTSTLGTWSDDHRTWRARITSPGARSLSLQLSTLWLPESATLTIANDRGDREVLTAADNRPQGLGTSPQRGDTLDLRYDGPAGVAPVIAIDTAVHGVRDIFARLERDVGDSQWCNVNAACPAGDDFRDPIRSVAHIVAPGWLCTGSLLNNADQDRTPYFLTANHCLGGNLNSWVFWFNWESDGCDNPTTSPAFDVVRGATLRANWDNTDFALLELNEEIPREYDVYYAGWDATGSRPPYTVGIHHPNGDIKKISTDDDSPRSAGNDWEVVWDDGTTEGGSSGSGLFDPSGRVIGQLFGGSATCAGGSDYYGQLAISWDSGPTRQSRLADWLDPDGVTGGVIDGLSSGYPVDAAIALLTPTDGGLACGGEAVVRLTNQGTDRLRDATLLIEVDGDTDEVSWRGNLAEGEAEEVAVPLRVRDSGDHTVTVRVRVEDDENEGNDQASATFKLAGSGVTSIHADFEGGLGDIAVVEDGGDPTWAIVDVDGGHALGMDNLTEDTSATTDAIVLPLLDLGRREATLSFDVAYATYGDPQYVDGLQVVAHDLCSGERTVLWEREGDDLATAPSQEDPFSPTVDEWDAVTVDLTGTGDLVQVSLVNQGGYGQWLYVDNIDVTTAGGGVCACSTADPRAALLALPLVLFGLRRRRS